MLIILWDTIFACNSFISFFRNLLLTKSFLSFSSDSTLDLTSSTFADATLMLISACWRCVLASSFFSSKIPMPTTSSIIFRLSSTVISASRVTAPCGIILIPDTLIPVDDKASWICLLETLLPFTL